MLRGTAARAIGGHYRRHFITYTLSLCLYAAGVAGGLVAAGSAEPAVQQEVRTFLTSWFADPAGNIPLTAYDKLLADAAATDVIQTAGVFWLLGLSIIGVPLMLAIVFSRGFALGFTARFIATTGSGNAFLATITLLPHHIPMLIGTLLAAIGALQFASVAARTLLARPPGISVPRQFAASTLLTLLAAVILLAARFAEAYITPLLLRLAVQYTGILT